MLTKEMNIAGQNEPGERLQIEGTVFKADGKTAFPAVIIYAYHTDNTGRYSKSGNETGIQKWHGRLHGWCKTDSAGHYLINSIRPASYPNSTIPAHIHSAFRLPGKPEGFYINDFVFKDDKFVTSSYISSLGPIGGSGVVDINRSVDGVWKGQRNIVLP